MADEVLMTIDPAATEPEIGAPAAERIVEGSPIHRTWNQEDDGNGLYAGTWESTPGAWRVSYDEWEFCQILAGVSVLSEEGGSSHTYRAGDAFVIRPGFRGVWQVLETTVKRYVIRV